MLLATLRVSRRPKRRGLAIFLVPEVMIERTAMAVPTRLALVMTRLTTVRLDDFGFGTHGVGVIKWWELVVMLHRSPSDMFSDGRFTVG